VLPGKKYKPEELLQVAWRRKWVLILPLLLATLAAVVMASKMPNRYRSTALMLVVPQRVPETYVRSTVTARIEDRLQSLRQEVLSRTRLEAIIREFNLYPGYRQVSPMEDIVERMRRDVTVEVVRGDAFRIGYVAPQARTAQRVAARLASVFSDANLRERAVLAEATTEFLQSELDEARRRLAEHEGKLADYQRRHAGELPSERQSNLGVLNSSQMQAQTLSESLNRDRDRRLLLERQIADLADEPPVVTVPVAPPPAPNGAGPTVPAGRTAAEQLAAAQEALRGMELRLKPEHPDMVAARRLIAELEVKAQADAQKATGPAPAAPPPRAANAEEIARRNRLRDMRAEMANLDIQIASKLSEEARLRQSVATYQARIEATPTRESELTALTRDYTTLQTNYQSLLARQQDAKVAANLERRQIGEQFRLVDPPRIPERPFSPNRPLMALVGALAGLALGLVWAGWLEHRDTSLRTEEDVVLALGLRVLARVPSMRSREEAQRGRRRALLLTGGLAVLLGGIAASWKYVNFPALWN
jgi:polysaccharide chain length determinant protein (PEP-CTERM system associated)